MKHPLQPATLGLFALTALVLAAVLVIVAGGRNVFAERHRYVLFFEEDISGLDVGAPVEYRGGRVGTVTSVSLYALGEGWSVELPVFIEIEPDRVTRVNPHGRTQRYNRDALARAFEQSGLRARLASQSILTGKLKVQLLAAPQTKGHTVDPGLVSTPQIPTVGSPWTALSQTISTLPLNEMVTETRIALSGVARLVNDPLTTGLLAQASVMLSELGDTNRRLSAWLAPGSPVQAGLTGTLADISALSTCLASRVSALSPEDVRETRRLADDALRELAAASAALRQATAEVAPLLDQASTGLLALERAMRGVRALTESLEANPEAVLRGKPKEE